MSAALVSYSEKEGTAERRKEVVEACTPVTFKTGVRSFRYRACTIPMTAHTQIDHDFVLQVAKRVTDARKQITEHVGKGMVRVCKTHA